MGNYDPHAHEAERKAAQRQPFFFGELECVDRSFNPEPAARGYGARASSGVTASSVPLFLGRMKRSKTPQAIDSRRGVLAP